MGLGRKSQHKGKRRIDYKGGVANAGAVVWLQSVCN